MNKIASLTPKIINIVRDKGTEPPYYGEYCDYEKDGTYLCRQCGIALYRASNKFISSCGWPSFDESLSNNVIRQRDDDGHRTEILCARCKAHLGHIFHGENFTLKNTRHCVNSLALDFILNESVLDTKEAIFAAGCFWGVQYYFDRLPGVLKTEVGYIGGDIKNPTYEQICQGNTGHVEAVRVIYDQSKLSYEQVCKYFFEIHDPTQNYGQGPDIGPQYLSQIYFYDKDQEKIASKVISLLIDQGLNIATKLIKISAFWPAEKYHQDYYANNGDTPYCHRYTKRFE